MASPWGAAIRYIRCLMHESLLRTVLLIRAIDQGDRVGEVLTLAERAEATRATAGPSGEMLPQLTGATLPAAAEKLLVQRAESLVNKLQSRSPIVARALDMADGMPWLGAVVAGLAFVTGVVMSALDGRQHVDLLAFPVLGLIAWNFFVYVALLAVRLMPRRRQKPTPSRLSLLYARGMGSRADALLRDSSRFNIPLAEALKRFAADWAVVSQPMLVLRAKRLFHFSAVLVALGLISGLYVRGLVLEYDAGWQSTFLGASQVRTLLGLLYGPASALSGIPLPSPADTERLRWTEADGGVPAAQYIHLIALTAGLYIVLPRLLLVLADSVALFRYRRNPRLPDEFMPYARSVLRETGRVSAAAVAVVSYAYVPAGETIAGLHALLHAALASDLKLELRHSVAYGDEDSFAQGLAQTPLAAADFTVLLMSLSATPEAENHGTMITLMQKQLAARAAKLLLVIDESAYAARVREDASLEPRRSERAEAWRAFATTYHQDVYVADLNRLRVGEEPDPSVRDGVREALHKATEAAGR
jgi:Protein of unknown function (DUF2868)